MVNRSMHKYFIFVILFPLLLCGCPLIPHGYYEEAMADYYILKYKKKSSHSVLVGASVSETEKLIAILTATFGYDNIRYDQIARAWFIKKRVIEASDSILVRCRRDEVTDKLVDQIFILREKNTNTEITVFWHSFGENELLQNPNSIIHFDWIAAIKAECDARGINTLIMR